jgi:hypothetical protein
MGFKQGNYDGIMKYLVGINGFRGIVLFVYNLNLDILERSFLCRILRLVFILLDAGFQLGVTHIHLIQVPSYN